MNQDASGPQRPVYRALETTCQEIRLLSISPSLRDNIIFCSLQTVRLTDANSNFKYVVLSYRWGTSDVSHKINLDGTIFYVRPNLWAFLDVIRKQPEMSLWIDALCINQENIEERNHQVRIMGDIFRSASMVLSWLGAGDTRKTVYDYESRDEPMALSHFKPNIGLAFELMSEVWSTSTTLSATDDDHSMSSSEADQLPNSRVNITQDHLWESVVVLCQHPYWDRAWVVQEILLSSTNYLLYNDSPLSWQVFANFLSLINVRFFPPAKYARAILSSTARSYALQKPYSMVPESLQWRTIGALVKHDFGRSWNRQEFNLFRILCMFGDRGCTDSLDHVYALLGLTQDGNDFVIRYGISAVELLLRVFHFAGTRMVQGENGTTTRRNIHTSQSQTRYRPASQRALIRNARYLAEMLELVPGYQKTAPYFHGSTVAKGPSPQPDPCFPTETQCLVLQCTAIEPGNEPPILRSNTLRKSMSLIAYDILLHLDESSSWLMCRDIRVNKSPHDRIQQQLVLVAIVTIKDGPSGRGFRILEPGNHLRDCDILHIGHLQEDEDMDMGNDDNETQLGKWEIAMSADAHLDFLKTIILGVQPVS